jgi:hypothetical protein
MCLGQVACPLISDRQVGIKHANGRARWAQGMCQRLNAVRSPGANIDPNYDICTKSREVCPFKRA